MKIIKKSVLACIMLALSSATEAGSTDGLKIAAVTNDSGAAYSKFIKQFMFDNSASQIDCGANYIDKIYIDPLPEELTGDRVIAAIGSKAKRKHIGRILSAFHDDSVLYGFDGVLAYEVKALHLSLYGISANPKYSVVVSTITLEDAVDQNKFNLALCKALTHLSILTAP